MTKRLLIGFLTITVIATFFFWKKEELPTVVEKIQNSPQPEANSSVPASSPIKTPSARTPASVGYVNQPSPDWEEKLTTSFKEQGGATLKEIKIVKERSFVWKRDDLPLHVNSVIVSLTTKEDVQTSFKALVDSQTGKVLETWDRSISDPANVREGFRFKLDPRYSN